MVELGVAEKQADKARQYFQRSAEQAGFFWSGKDRLVMPAAKVDGEPGKAEQDTADLSKDEKAGGNGGDDGGRHPFIQGLIKTLPKAESPWPIEKRAQWLQAAVSVFNLIYADNESGGSIEVKFEKGASQ